MDKLVYLIYPLLALILLWGVRLYKSGCWNEEFMSLSQTKMLQGFCAICIMLHHAGQKTCAPWLNPWFIKPGLELFVPIGYFLVGIFLFCSGYGLYKSYQTKENYLQGFCKKRILPLILAFYSTALIFLAVRFLLGEKMDGAQIFYYVSGLQLCNPNAWFAIALPIFYLGFYLAFKYLRKERAAVFVTCMVVFVYTLIGTVTDHNDWWMRGEWWYNSVHFFPLGLLFARHEEKIIRHIKKFYRLYLPLALVSIFIFYAYSEYTQAVFSYYGENFNADFKVLRRWVCLLSQVAASCAFVFSVFMVGMKIQIGNRVLKFMGTITLEFYLIHGLFVELFGFSFGDTVPGLYYIRNVACFVFVVMVLSLPAAYLLKKFHNFLLQGKGTVKSKKTEKNSE
ncbi:MAG: acyltransferase [Lachnospiraceae bacterium]|nr:acyltransferase [Lachnospiraceae bacterium]